MNLVQRKVLKLVDYVHSKSLSVSPITIHQLQKLFKQIRFRSPLNKGVHSTRFEKPPTACKWELLVECGYNSGDDVEERASKPKVKQAGPQRRAPSFMTLSKAPAPENRDLSLHNFTAERIEKGQTSSSRPSQSSNGRKFSRRKGSKEKVNGKIRYRCEHCDEIGSTGKIPANQISSTTISYPSVSETGNSVSGTENSDVGKENRPRINRRLTLKKFKISGKAIRRHLRTGFIAMGKSVHAAALTSPQFFDYQDTATEYVQTKHDFEAEPWLLRNKK